MKTVAVINGNGYKGMSKGQIRTKIIDELRHTGFKVDRLGFGTIIFDEKRLNTGLDYEGNPAELAAFSALPKVLKQGMEIHSRDNHKGRDYGTVTFAAPVEFNGTVGIVAVVVKQTSKNFYKAHRVLAPDGRMFVLPDKKDAEPTTGGGVTENGSLATPIDPAPDISISSNSENVNGKASLENNYKGKSLADDSTLYTYDFLTDQKDMQVVWLPLKEDVNGADGRINRRDIVDKGLGNAVSAGKIVAGKVYVKNAYTGRDIRIDGKTIRHGLDPNRILSSAKLCAKIGDLVKNAIPINALHNAANGVFGTYAMAAYAADKENHRYIAIITVEQRCSEIENVEVFDVAHAISGREKRDSLNDTQSASQGVNPLATVSTIKIADLIDVVKSTYQSILSNDVLSHYGEGKNPNGTYAEKAKFSLETPERLSTLEDERDDLRAQLNAYKEKVEALKAQTRKTADIRLIYNNVRS